MQMKQKKKITVYSPAEEKLNVISHFIGLIFSIPAFFLLIIRASRYGEPGDLTAAAVFGLSLILLYSASTIYHSAEKGRRKQSLQVFDHAAIYVLIAGTYTPYTLITLEGRTGWILFAVIWTLALCGVILKLFFTGKFEIILTLMYIFMGWIIILALGPLMENLSLAGVILLFAGGVSYTWVPSYTA
ncbi:MAG: hemolysin III family protein [Candidatus Marinimicrobia bacterium]|nr:hemolysin III family protein [Candidatus Neomarinimicrobiota bacterium]